MKSSLARHVAGTVKRSLQSASRPRRTDAEIFHHNVFGLFRVLFASAVIFGHVWVINFEFAGLQDPINVLRIHDLGTGQVVVIGFFSISGFLISRSSRRNATLVFLVRRAGRLLPGYWFMLVVTAVLLEPILFLLVHATLHGLPVFGSQSIATYVLKNCILIQVQGFIPGVVSHGMQLQVNGSAWSLPYEALCYLTAAAIVLVLRRVREMRYEWLPSVLISVLLLAVRVVLSFGVVSPTLTELAIPLVVDVDAFFISYTIGCFDTAWMTRRDVRILVPVAFATVVASGHWDVVGELLFPFVTLVFATYSGGLGLRRVGQEVDLSYGIYLFAWPIQQMFAAKRVFVTHPYVNFIAVLVTVMPLAAMSWFLVERPCHRRIGRWASGRGQSPDVVMERELSEADLAAGLRPTS